MAPRSKVTVSVKPVNHRPSSSERRAAQMAALSNQQADLKREAAERREQRAQAAGDTGKPDGGDTAQ